MLTKAQVKYIQNLGHKKFRDEDEVFLAEGPKLIEELVYAENVKLYALYAVEEYAGRFPQLPNVVIIKQGDLERISFLTTPNQVVGIFHKPVFPSRGIFKNRISLVLDNVQDPGNMGTIIRCADWFGIESIVCSEHSADVFNPKVIQSTMGSIARVNVMYKDLLKFLSQTDLPPVYATTTDGNRNILEIGKLKEGLILIGNESKGISEELLQTAKVKITIPRRGKAESLNAAVATGIVLSHVC